MPTNVSLYTVPAAWCIAIMPRAYTVTTFTANSKAKTGPELLNPRAFSSQINNDKTLTHTIRGRCMRAESAQFNGLENVGYFAAAVLAGNFAGLNPELLNRLSVGYLGTRILYNAIFIFNDKVPVLMRTLTFLLGIAINSTLFIMSGKAINAQ